MRTVLSLRPWIRGEWGQTDLELIHHLASLAFFGGNEMDLDYPRFAGRRQDAVFQPRQPPRKIFDSHTRLNIGLADRNQAFLRSHAQAIVFCEDKIESRST
jgi:hypothetical protein